MRLSLLYWVVWGAVAQAMAAPVPATLRVGIPEGLPGYTMQPDSKLEVEVPAKKRVVACIEKHMNTTFAWEAYPTKRVLKMLMDGQLDLAFPMGFTPERASKMLQSQPTWGNADYLLSRQPIDMANNDVRIAARLGSPQQVDYAAEGYRNVRGTYTYQELIKMLESGVADVVIIPQSVFEDQRADWPKDTIVTVGSPRNTGFYLHAADPRGLIGPLNRAIERCGTASK